MKMCRQPVVAIVGNTGVGKSQLAVEIARAFNGEIINADVMQMYKGLDVVTNKHPLAERKGIPHHLLGTVDWNKKVTIKDFEDNAIDLIAGMHDRGKLPVVVGGTHYYIQSLLAKNTLVADNTTPHTFTEEQLRILNDSKLVEKHLAEVDPAVLQKFHPNDTRRTRRALEIFFETGRKPSKIYEEQKAELRYRVLVLWVWCNQSVLDERLDNRVDKMVDMGLMSEVEQLNTEYKGEKDGIFQVLGFQQFLPYLSDKTTENYEKGLEDMKQETRQYAKRQRKWIKNKLSPFIDKLGGDFAVVDSSNLAEFNTNVEQRACEIVRGWLNSDDGNWKEMLVPEYLSSEVVRTRPDFDKSQWTRHHCADCSELRNKDVTLVGDEDWKIHLASKSHRSARRRLEKLKQKNTFPIG